MIFPVFLNAMRLPLLSPPMAGQKITGISFKSHPAVFFRLSWLARGRPVVRLPAAGYETHNRLCAPANGTGFVLNGLGLRRSRVFKQSVRADRKAVLLFAGLCFFLQGLHRDDCLFPPCWT